MGASGNCTASGRPGSSLGGRIRQIKRAPGAERRRANVQATLSSGRLGDFLLQLAIVGIGYVGLVAGSCLADAGHRVVCIENDPARLARVRRGEMPFYEPGLSDLLARNIRVGRLTFEGTMSGVRGAEIVFIAVGTPAGADGRIDLREFRAAAGEVARALDGPCIIVNKSTVPVGTAELLATIVDEYRSPEHAVEIVANPEFLREGSAIADFRHPDRIVIGTAHAATHERMHELYAAFGAPFFDTDVRTAEMIKYVANALLAAKVSLVNEIAHLCEVLGVDVQAVAAGAGADTRIGTAFLDAGIGFGGSCLPKDVLALIRSAEHNGVTSHILEAVVAVNAAQVEHASDRLDAELGGLAGRRVAVLGLAFKPETDDVRESRAVALVRHLCDRGAVVVACDPAAAENARAVLGDAIAFAPDAYAAANDADAVVIATAWDAYAQLDLRSLHERMAGRVFYDGRNAYDPAAVTGAGFIYLGVGRRRVDLAAGDPLIVS